MYMRGADLNGSTCTQYAYILSCMQTWTDRKKTNVLRVWAHNRLDDVQSIKLNSVWCAWEIGFRKYNDDTRKFWSFPTVFTSILVPAGRSIAFSSRRGAAHHVMCGLLDQNHRMPHACWISLKASGLYSLFSRVSLLCSTKWVLFCAGCPAKECSLKSVQSPTILSSIKYLQNLPAILYGTE